MRQDLAMAGGLICAIVGFVLAVVLTIAILYLLTLQKALNRVQPHNRLMQPGLVWLSLIPCFNIIWQFFIAIQVPGSLRNEFCERGRDDGSDYGKSIALTNAILGIISFPINGVTRISKELEIAGGCVLMIIGLAQFVLFILFWVKIANYSGQLAFDEGDGRDLKRAFDDYDDGGSPRGRSGGPPPETYRPDDQRYRP